MTELTTIFTGATEIAALAAIGGVMAYGIGSMIRQQIRAELKDPVKSAEPQKHGLQ